MRLDIATIVRDCPQVHVCPNQIAAKTGSRTNIADEVSAVGGECPVDVRVARGGRVAGDDRVGNGRRTSFDEDAPANVG